MGHALTVPLPGLHEQTVHMTLPLPKHLLLGNPLNALQAGWIDLGQLQRWSRVVAILRRRIGDQANRPTTGMLYISTVNRKPDEEAWSVAVKEFTTRLLECPTGTSIPSTTNSICRSARTRDHSSKDPYSGYGLN